MISEMDEKYLKIHLLFILVVISMEVDIISGVRCPRGWEPIGCDYKWQCVIPMEEFDSEKACIRKGGIPSAVACLTRGRRKLKESTNRYCVKDLKDGEIGFARNLKLAIAAMERKEKEEAEKEDGAD